MKRLSIGVLALAMAGAQGVAGPLSASGPTAPALSLPAAGGNLMTLAALRGRVVLIDFWASWCAPCKMSFPALDALFRDYESAGLTVLAVNVDERRRDADTFLATRAHTMPVLFDPKGESPAAFAVKGMPTSVLVDRAGVIRFTHMGYSERTVQSFRQEIVMLLKEQ